MSPAPQLDNRKPEFIAKELLSRVSTHDKELNIAKAQVYATLALAEAIKTIKDGK